MMIISSVPVPAYGFLFVPLSSESGYSVAAGDNVLH